MAVRDFPPRPQGATPDSVPYQNWLDALGNRQNIDLLQELTSVDSADEVAIFDASETGQNKTKKITVANLLSGGGISGPGSSTDNAVARWDGTGGDTLQDSAFIVDNSGHVTSFGGQIKFPATQAPSSDANTLDDYEEGTYTPTWSTSGAAPSLGNGTITGIYTKIGRSVTARVQLTMGSTTTYGSGEYYFTLPFTASATGYLGSSRANDSGTRAYAGICQAFSTTQIRSLGDVGGGANWGASVPHVWANTDFFESEITFFV